MEEEVNKAVKKAMIELSVKFEVENDVKRKTKCNIEETFIQLDIDMLSKSSDSENVEVKKSNIACGKDESSKISLCEKTSIASRGHKEQNRKLNRNKSQNKVQFDGRK